MILLSAVIPRMSRCEMQGITAWSLKPKCPILVCALGDMPHAAT
jgi:hypothetical protein